MNNQNNLESKEGEVVKLATKKPNDLLDLGKNIYIGTVNIFVPPLSHYHTQRYTGKKHHLILDTFLAILIFVLLGVSLYYLFQIRHLRENISINLVAKESLTSGKQATFELTINNKTNNVFSNVSLHLEHPENIQIAKSEQVSWNVAELAPQEKRIFSFKATPYGLIGDSIILKSFITYTSSKNERRGNYLARTYQIEKSIYDISLETPPAISVNKPFEIKILIKSEENLQDGLIDLVFSQSFLLKSSVPTVKEDGWLVTTKDKEYSIIINSIFLASAKEKESISVSYSTQVGEKQVLLAQKDYSYSIIHPEISLSLSSKTDSVSPGSALPITLTYQNNSADTVKEVKITCSLQGENLNGLSLQSAEGYVSNNNIIFTSKNIKSLEQIPTQRKDELSFSMTAGASIQEKRSLTINCSLVGTEQKEGKAIEIAAYSTLLDLSVSQAITFSSFGYYVAGNLPPQVGYPTIYRLFFEISDPSTSIHNLSVTCEIPVGVDYLGNISASAGTAPQYNESTRKISWIIEEYTTETEKIQASFEVRLIPNKNHLGHALELLSDSELIFSYENETSQNKLSADHLTTQLKADTQTLQKGIVVK